MLQSQGRLMRWERNPLRLRRGLWRTWLVLAILATGAVGLRAQVNGDSAAETTTIDVGFFYTPAARTYFGGTAQTEAEIDLRIAATNRVFSISGVHAELSLAGAEEVSYEEQDSISSDLSNLQGAEDGHMDGIHEARDRMGADIVVLIAYLESSCGIAYVPVAPQNAFTVVGARCSTQTLPHEVGHLLGVMHDRHKEYGSLNNSPQSYNYGYVNQRAFEHPTERRRRWRTVMSYSQQCVDAGFYCQVVLAFSTPHRTFRGDPMGVAVGDQSMGQGPADAVRKMNETREIVARHRSRPQVPVQPSITVSIAAVGSPVAEGTAAVFEVTLDGAAPEPLAVSVNVNESGSALAGTPPNSVTVAAGATSARLSVPTEGDRVVEADSMITAELAQGVGYTLGTASSAVVKVEDDDTATFTLSAEPQAIPEGDSAFLRVAIANGVTFATDEVIELAASGTASPADYIIQPVALTLQAGSVWVEGLLTARADGEDEEDETVTVAASHGDVPAGSATLTITNASNDATLSALSLSGIDFGTFSPDVTEYAATVSYETSATTVTATASHPAAWVTVEPGVEVALDVGSNIIQVYIEAENDETKRVYTVTVTRAGPPLTASVVSVPESHAGSGTFIIRVRFSEPVATGDGILQDGSFSVTNGSVRNALQVEGRSDLWDIVIEPSSGADVVVLLPAAADCALSGAVCTADGRGLSNRIEATVPGPVPVVTIAAVSDSVTEGAPAAFAVTLDKAAPAALSVVVSVTGSGSMLSGTPPTSVTVAQGDTSATLAVSTEADSVVEPDGTVTATVAAGTGYSVGSASSAAVTVEDDDAPAFTVSVAPEVIAEGETATLTVAITNGVTFAEAQPIPLTTTGTASAVDYTGVPPTLTLAAGATSATAALAASADREEEEPETVTVTASHGEVVIGSATVTITSVSRDATLASLSLSGIDIGVFSSTVTAYTASVAHSVTATTVTATATHSGATVSIAPGPEVALAEGANEITVTVTAENGTTTQAYTVTVTRSSLPVVSIAAVEERVSEAETGGFRISRTGPISEPLEVPVRLTSTRSSKVQNLTARFLPGQRSVTGQVQHGDNTIVEDDVTVTWTLQEGEGYTVSGESASASLVFEENDVPEFAVTLEPSEITEGETATLTVAITNGVTFRAAQTITLAASGTASASDYRGLPETLRLSAQGSSATARLTAVADGEQEAAETLTVTASHGGSAVGSATVTIMSVARDATLSALSLSGIDIGRFSAATTAYRTSVAHSVTTTTVTARATDPGATVSIAPGPEVALSEGANEIAVTVTAGDGSTTQTYTVTVTRSSLPVATIAAGATPVTEGTPASFTLSLDAAAPEALTVAVSMAESGAVLSGTPPSSVAFAKGATSATLSVPTSADSVVEADSTVTATLMAGTGYSLGTDILATVAVQDDDAATFTVSAEPQTVAEGESATLTVAIANGVTFAEDQTISLATSGTASAADYTGLPATLTLGAGASSATALLRAAADQEEEAAETVTVTASRGGSAIGSATVTIESVSQDATLAGLSLSGIDLGVFSSTVTAYTASVAHSVTATTVTATATHSGATVSIRPGPEVALAEGANEITVTVTAENGTTTQTYTVTVTRSSLPVVSIMAVEERVSEADQARFRVSRTGTASEPLEVPVLFTSTRSSEVQNLTVRFLPRQRSVTSRVEVGDDTIVEDDLTVTYTLQAGAGYAVSEENGSAAVVFEENDVPEFAVTLEPGEIAEGETATLTVAITNGVTFRAAQTIALAASGTASAADYRGLPETLRLSAYGTSATFSTTARLTAVADGEQEAAETLTVTASHGGSAVGSATVTIMSAARDATLSALSLSGIDIGRFSAATTAYRTSVARSVTTTTVTARATDPGATVSIAPGPEVALSEGANEIAVTVTAGDGSTTQTYTVTVTRMSLPVVSIVADEEHQMGPIGVVRLSRTGPTGEPLEVRARLSLSDRTNTTDATYRIPRGSSSVSARIQAGENLYVEDDITVTWTLREGEGYSVSAEQSSASVVLEESEVPEFSVTVDPAEIAEGGSATVTVAITNRIRFKQEQTIALSVSGTASGADYTGLPATLTLAARAYSATTTLTAVEDQGEEGAETVTITASHEGSEIGSATVTIAASEASAALTAEFLQLPATHDGQAAFTFELHFSREPALSFRTLRDTAFRVTGGRVRKAKRLVAGSNLRWEITVEPTSEADVALTLPATADCAALGAICTAGGSKLAQAVSAIVSGPRTETAGFPLARGNSRPSGIWSDGETVWVADLEDAKLYAYRRADGERQPGREMATEPGPMGLWSDGETLWVAGLQGGLRAHRLADGARLAARDVALEGQEAPAGVWSDGETVWAAGWLGDRVRAYRLADGERLASRDIALKGENLMPVGLWSDGETLWVADWRERLYAYRLADGRRVPQRDVEVSGTDADPTGLWSGGGTLLATGWEGREVRAYRLPAAGASLAAEQARGHAGAPGRLPVIADPALGAAIRAALGKAPGETVSAGELAGLASLSARNAGIRDLAGLEAATGLKELDLGFNPLADLRQLALLPGLESLNLDGAALDLRPLAALAGLRRLSVRHNLLEELQPLGALAELVELDIGDNRVEDLRPLAGLARLAVLRADRNGIADLWPLASVRGLETLDLGANRVRDLQPLAGLERLRRLRLDGNRLSELHPLSGLRGLEDLGLARTAVRDLGPLAGLDGLRRLDLRGSAVRDLLPLRRLASLASVHVGGSRIRDLAPLDGLDGLSVEGRDDLEPPGAGDARLR